MASAPGPTKKEVREAENKYALGRMRNPTGSVRRLPGKGEGCEGVHDALLQILLRGQSQLREVRDILKGAKSGGFSVEFRFRAREAARAALQIDASSTACSQKGLQPDIIEGMT